MVFIQIYNVWFIKKCPYKHQKVLWSNTTSLCMWKWFSSQLSNHNSKGAKDKLEDYIINYASNSNFLLIVQYLIKKQNINVDIKDNNEESTTSAILQTVVT